MYLARTTACLLDGQWTPYHWSEIRQLIPPRLLVRYYWMQIYCWMAEICSRLGIFLYAMYRLCADIHIWLKICILQRVDTFVVSAINIGAVEKSSIPYSLNILCSLGVQWSGRLQSQCSTYLYYGWSVLEDDSWVGSETYCFVLLSRVVSVAWCFVIVSFAYHSRR